MVALEAASVVFVADSEGIVELVAELVDMAVAAVLELFEAFAEPFEASAEAPAVEDSSD
jgi:hypothetical protein